MPLLYSLKLPQLAQITNLEGAKMAKSYEEINKRIRNGKAVVVTAEEIIGIVDEIGLEAAAEKVDVVTTATFGPMCSTGAFLNFGHTSPATRMEKIFLNDVEAYGGLAAVDTYIGATQESETEGYDYGGAHVICDLIDGKSVKLNAKGKGTDCYPSKKVEAEIKLDSINEAYLYNPRNCYQNYAAASNSSDKIIYTYMGPLKAKTGNVTYSTSGQLSPLLNDPLYRTIGVGTRIFIGGATGYVSWRGTQFNSAADRDENNDIPKGTGATLALIGDLKNMDTRYIKPGVFKDYGCTMYVGVGIPIPVLDTEILKSCAIKDEDIYTNVLDYSVSNGPKPVLARVSYADLKTGQIEIEGKKVKTAPITSLVRSREIADLLKQQIEEGSFELQKPIELFPTTPVGPLKDRSGEA